MDRNLALEFVRVTEAAALACAPWLGKGDKNAADQAAVQAMRSTMNDVNFCGTVIIGEGEKDEAPMLYSGEKVGNKETCTVDVDLAIDPLEGTSLVAGGKDNAICVLAAAPKGKLMKAPGTYMDCIIVGPKATGAIDLTKSITENIHSIAKALDKEIEDLTVCMLERKRLDTIRDEIRATGARIRLIEHGTVNAGIAAAIPDTGIDVYMGDSGAPEVVITAAAISCLGGEVQARIKPHNEKTTKEAEEMGLINKVLKTNDLAAGDNLMFAATGVSDGPFLKGIIFKSHGALSHSIVMRSKSKTSRFIETHHHFASMPDY